MNKFEVMLSMLEELQDNEKHEGEILSTHEGYARIVDKLDDLWLTIKCGRYPDSKEHLKQKAVRVGAVVVRFLADIIQGDADDE